MYPPEYADVGVRPLRAPRANHVSCTDEKRIRARNMVMVKNQRGLGLFLLKIADCADGPPSAQVLAPQLGVSSYVRGYF
jgi:hypothetical protein